MSEGVGKCSDIRPGCLYTLLDCMLSVGTCSWCKPAVNNIFIIVQFTQLILCIKLIFPTHFSGLESTVKPRYNTVVWVHEFKIAL